MASDGAAFDALCAAQMSYGHSGGKIQTKEEFIADATSGKAKWKALEFANARNTVLCAPDGCPIAIEVFEGNTGDPKKPWLGRSLHDDRICEVPDQRPDDDDNGGQDIDVDAHHRSRRGS